jgi:hypothetical protein
MCIFVAQITVSKTKIAMKNMQKVAISPENKAPNGDHWAE